MKVVLKPTVEVIAKTEFIGHPTLDIPDDGTDAERTGAFSAKACYRSFGKDTGRSVVENQVHIVKSRHGRILEHSSVTLSISGITRALSLELMTHKHLHCSQESTRYVDMKETGIVLEPYYARLFEIYQSEYKGEAHGWGVHKDIGIAYTPEALKEISLLTNFLNHCQWCMEQYEEQVNGLMELNPEKLTGTALRKWARGKARNILNESLATHVVATGSHRAWRTFLESRLSVDAESEIRRLASAIYPLLMEIAPSYYQDFKQTNIKEEIPELVPTYSKV